MEQRSDRRLSNRRFFNQPLSFEISLIEGQFEIIKKDATGVDISSEGLGMTTDYVLNKGGVLKLYIPTAVDTFLPVFAEVMWSMPADTRFRAGLRFLS